MWLSQSQGAHICGYVVSQVGIPSKSSLKTVYIDKWFIPPIELTAQTKGISKYKNPDEIMSHHISYQE